MVINASGYPQDGNDGIQMDTRTLEITGIQQNSWADASTDIGKYIGWHMTKLNTFSLKNWDDVLAAFGNLTSEDTIEITLKVFF